jgi:hypothetical protein
MNWPKEALALLSVVSHEPGIAVTAARTGSHDLRWHKASNCIKWS